MAKKVIGQIKLQIPAGKATPAPPGEPNKKKVATLTSAQIREIAELKMPDLNAASVEAAMSMVAGTARSMGIVVED